MIGRNQTSADILKALLDGGADHRLTTDDQTTPLMAAAGLGQPTFDPGLKRGVRSQGAEDAVKLLLDAGADINAVNEADFAAIHGAAFRGLNLTFEVREGIIKHSHDYSARQHPELAEYLLDRRPPLEAQLIDLTDEIAYNTADLDDGYEARLLPLEQIRGGVPVFERFFREVENIYPDAPDKLKFNEALKRMLNRLVGDLIANTQSRVNSAGVQTLDDVRSHPSRLAAFSPEVEAERKQAKDFLYENLYFSATLEPEKDAAECIIRDLFALWMENPKALPPGYQEQAERESLPRVICDYIAGMTDNYIISQHENHCG